MPTKKCKSCGLNKSKDEFYKHATTKDKLNQRCKDCYYSYTRVNTINYLRHKNTGCSKEKYNDLYIKQKGCCAICGKHASEFKSALCADHCHETKEVRGLLCGKCNRGIGNLNDDVVLLTSAIHYLTKE